jgi:hypothetical protein
MVRLYPKALLWPHGASEEVPADLQISKIELKHGVLLGAWLAGWRTGLFGP